MGPMMLQFEWIDPKVQKPQGEVFWALTKGRPEWKGRDWEIIKLMNDDHGDYRTLDEAGRYDIAGSWPYVHWCSTIVAWAPIECIPIDDAKIEAFNDTK